MPGKPQLHRLLRSRRSVRRFSQKPVPEAMVHRIIRTAMRAPSAHNRQPWRFVWVKERATKRRLAAALLRNWVNDLRRDGRDPASLAPRMHRSFRRIMDAPVLLLLCYDRATEDSFPDPERQRAAYLMGVQSTALAGVYALLAAEAEGLRGVWVCAPLFAQDLVRQVLALPESWEPHAFLYLGYPAEEPRPKCLRPLAQVLVRR